MFLNIQVIIVGLDSFFLFFWFIQPYYILAKNPDPYPPPFGGYLNKLAPTIGGEVKWAETSEKVYDNFLKTGKSIILDPLKGGFFSPLCIS